MISNIVYSIKNTISMCRNVNIYTKLLSNRYTTYWTNNVKMSTICPYVELSTNRLIYKEI